MLRFRRRTLGALVLAGLVLASLRPDPRVEAVAGWLAAPARVLAELGLPLAPLAAAPARAAERRLELESRADERLARLALEAEERAASPLDPALLAGRRLVHAAVLEALAYDKDHLLLALPPRAGARVGAPVVRGERFVGRLVEVDDARGRAVLALASDAAFRVGAVLDLREERADADGSARLVVGGLAPEVKGPSPRLAVHHPSRRALPAGGLVRVLESSSALDEALGSLADGYRLGRLERIEGPWVEPAFVLRPELDFAGGLSRLVVLLSAEEGRPLVQGLPDDPLAPEGWRTARVALAASAAPQRAVRALACGTTSGVRQGDAARAGAWLVGRVARAGPLESELALLGDPGLVVPAQALVLPADARADDPDALARAELVPLGRLVAIAREPSGRSRWLWSAHVALEAEPEATARGAWLFSASGERGLPSGLVLGTTRLPTGPGPHVLELEGGVDGGALRVVALRAAEEARP